MWVGMALNQLLLIIEIRLILQTKYLSLSQGDSGGGVVYQDKIYGVVSFLGDPVNVCRKAAAFMNLCNPEYAKWVRETIDIKIPPV